MTQMGIEYQKLLESRRSNQANEAIKNATLAEDIRHHDLQRQTSLDVASTQAAASRYAADAHAGASRYATDVQRVVNLYNTDKNAENARYAADQSYNAAKLKTYAGNVKSGDNLLEQVVNGIGFLWDTLI